ANSGLTPTAALPLSGSAAVAGGLQNGGGPVRVAPDSGGHDPRDAEVIVQDDEVRIVPGRDRTARVTDAKNSGRICGSGGRGNLDRQPAVQDGPPNSVVHGQCAARQRAGGGQSSLTGADLHRLAPEGELTVADTCCRDRIRDQD